jgi:hypothetical protein
MDGILKSLAQHNGELLLLFLLIAAGMVYALVSLQRRVASMRSHWTDMLDGSKGGNLEILLENHLRERLQMQQQLTEAMARIEKLEKRMQTTKRHLGLVRYNAFEDVGGSQSFALAIYDDKGDGAIINSLVGRTDCRVYCKPLLNGRSERSLSQEEQRAIMEAVSSRPRSIVS